MEIPERICKLCLQKCGRNFQEIEDTMKNVLEILLPIIDFTVIKEPVMCELCTEMVINCFDFKATCLDTHDYIVPFIANKGVNKLDLKDVYASKNVSCGGVSEYYKVCGFCMSLVNDCSTVSFDVEEEGIRLEEMIKQCLPELDFNLIRNPVSCAPCHRSLKNCFYFLMNCLNVEENRQKYCQPLYTNAKDKVDRSSFILIVRDTENELDDNSHDIIQVEEQSREEKINLMGEIGNGGNADGDIKNNNGRDSEQDGEKANNAQKLTPKNMFVCEKDSNKFGTINTEEDLCEMRDKVCLFNEELEIKTNDHEFNRFEESIIMTQTTVKTIFNSRQECLKSKLDLIKPHIKQSLHVDPSEVTMFNCNSCPFQTKLKGDVKNHMLKHLNPSDIAMFKCDSCTFQTKTKGNLKTHMLTHMNPSDIAMFKCDSCTFQTKTKSNIKAHMLKHMNLSDIAMFKCDSCTFQTKTKGNIKTHMSKHMNPSDIAVFKCDSCTFQTKTKRSIKTHVLKHMNPSDIAMFKCDSCSFQTKWKHALKDHAIKHVDPSEVTMFKCDSCTFQTGNKGTIKTHMLKHMNPSDIAMFKCDSCSFKTWRKDTLKRHVLKHMHPSEVTMFKCDSCSYQTKWKHALKNHALKHMDPPEVTMFTCDSCPYQTRWKVNLKTHTLKHMDPPVVTMFKCNSCPFQSRWKISLKSHVLKHMDSSVVTLFKCDSCPFQTKWKDYLKCHVVKHMDPSHSDSVII